MEELIRAGLDVARFNMSHGSHEEHARRLAETRAAAKAIGKTIGLLADLQGNKGINLPGVAVNVPALSEKDEDDLRFALRNNFDLIALSFVRNASDVTRVREVMAEEGLTLPVIAKIEKPQAVENLDEIIAAFDAFMVVRGDLGVELPLEFVPMVQKDIISKARIKAKPVIVATQMLDSMIGSPTPTRAETSDVANAILDGADAVMLSGETSIGAYPVKTVATMARIIAKTEDLGGDRVVVVFGEPIGVPGHTNSLNVHVAHDVKGKSS